MNGCQVPTFVTQLEPNLNHTDISTHSTNKLNEDGHNLTCSVDRGRNQALEKPHITSNMLEKQTDPTTNSNTKANDNRKYSQNLIISY